MIIPLRVEDATVNRLPWVSISIAALCAVMFLATWVVPREPDGIPDESIVSILEYWEVHPYLKLPDRLLGMLNSRARRQYEAKRERGVKLAKDQNRLPDEEEIAREQEALETRVAELFQRADRTLFRRLAMVPERGWLQLGLVTHMFLHLGWMHLLGNMLFFYIAGLLLEDRWGRGVFAGFYLVGGVVAASAHYALDRQSPVLMVGASGAIAACMGAFAVRFAMKQIRMGYFFFIGWRFFRGTFLMRAWFAGLIWFLLEVINFKLDPSGDSGVAVMAHIAGFGFGAVIAMGLGWSGVEARYIRPAVEKATFLYVRPESLDRADEALARGDAVAARAELEKVLKDDPENLDAEITLLKLDGTANPSRTAARMERLVARLLTKGPDVLAHAVETLGPALDPAVLRPPTAFRLGMALESGPEGLRPAAERMFAAAAREPGPFAAKALVRAAQAALDGVGDPNVALEYLEKLGAIASVPVDLQARAGELEKRARELAERERGLARPGLADRAIALDDEEPPPPPPPPPPGASGAPPDTEEFDPFAAMEDEPAEAPRAGSVRVVECQLGGMTKDALSLVMDGGRRADVSIGSLLAVAVGVAPETAKPPAPPKQILYTDLVTSWGGPKAPAEVLRLKSSTLRLQNIYPGMAPQEAYGLFLRHLLDRSGATALPDDAALRRGEYPRYPDAESLTRAIYG